MTKEKLERLPLETTLTGAEVYVYRNKQSNKGNTYRLRDGTIVENCSDTFSKKNIGFICTENAQFEYVGIGVEPALENDPRHIACLELDRKGKPLTLEFLKDLEGLLNTNFIKDEDVKSLRIFLQLL